MANSRKLAYSLIEILVTIAVIGGLAAIGYVTMKSVHVGTGEVKLEQDVTTVNRAIKMYLANGGKLPAESTGDEVLAMVARQSADLKKNAGLKGSLIDPRLRLTYQSSAEAQVPGKRAQWDEEEQQFYLTTNASAQPGIKEFTLGEMPAPRALITDANGKIINPNLDERQTYGTFASVDSWVWDYDNNGSTPRSAPTTIGAGDATATTEGGAQNDEMIVLDPPTFSVPAGRYDLTWFPRSLTLAPSANTPTGVSEIHFLAPGGTWQRYTGPFEINDPGHTITAKTVSLDLDHYDNSVDATAIYTANAVPMEAAHSLRSTYRYAELGGPLAPGSLTPNLAPVPRIYLANANDIPDYFERDLNMQAFYTLDGTSPLAPSSSRFSGISSFSNGYPGDPLDLTLTSFNNSNTLSVKYLVQSKNPNVVTSSEVKTATTALAVTPLLAPIVTPESSTLSGEEEITMMVNTEGAQTPANARIYYRIDGSDPGDLSGEPAAGATLYTGGFNLDATTSPTLRIVARVYPPAAYKKWFTTSPPAILTYYIPYAADNVYGLLGGNKEIYNINPSTGTNLVFNNTSPYNLRALALDTARARIYYVEENAIVASGWRLGYYNILANNHVTLGNLRSTWGYNANAQPENLAFFNDGVYYIHAGSDDLVRVALNADSSGISSVTKVADLRSNNNFSNVGDMAVDETGLMFFVDSNSGYHRYDLVSMSNYLALSTTTQSYQGLAFYQSLLFASRSASSTITRLAPTTGSTLATVNADNSKRFVDLASPSSLNPINTAQSMWGIDDQADGPHLIEFRNNYRSPLISTAVDYGPIKIGDLSLLTDVRYGIRSLAIASNGMAYFVNNTPLRFGNGNGANNPWRTRPLLKLNIGTLKLGDAVNATFVGDLGPNLATIAGTLDPDDVVTGITLSPTGTLFGVLQEGSDSGANSADYLFKCTQAATGISGPNIGIVSVGRLTSDAGTSSQTEDLVFSRDGRLFCSDASTNNIWEVSPTTGSVLSLMSFSPGAYHGLAIDNNDHRMVASDVGGVSTTNSFVQVNGGPENDEFFVNYQERWGYTSIEAISFFQAPFLLLSSQVDLFAADGTKTIRGVDFETGQTVPVTDAPWPVRAIAYDIIKREVFYLRGGSSSFNLGSFNRDTFVHKSYGDLKGSNYAYSPTEVPDNLMYFGGYLWYVEPKTDNLIRINAGSGTAVGLPAGTVSSVITTQTPTDTTTGNGDFELGMKFQTAVNGTITHMKYFRPAEETGNHIGRIWSGNGALLASAAFTNETASGWQTVALATPLPIIANTTYVVSANCNTAYASTNTGGWGGTPYNFTNGQVRSVQNQTIGVLNPTPGSWPFFPWQNSNYFRDIVFVGGTSGDFNTPTNTIIAQQKVTNLTNNEMRFDLIGDLAMTEDGWVYFSAIRSDGQRFCRFQINTLNQFEVLSGPIASPVLVPDGENYRENWFDALAFSPANASGARTLYSCYSAAPSPLHTVEPSTGLSTFARTISPSISLIDFSDQHQGELSDPNAITLRPVLKINDLRPFYTYADVGGPFLTGSIPPPALVINPTVVLNNPNELLLSQQNSAHFQVRWSTDGVDPRTSTNPSVTGAFTDGFPGQQLSVAYSLWGNRSSLPLKVVAQSLQTNVMVDSPVLSPSIPAARMVLDEPLISEIASASNGDRQFTITANIGGGLIPPGTRIYYTVDEAAPGVARDASGLDNPTSGAVYTGPITISPNATNGKKTVLIHARLYPPTALPQWFAASDASYQEIEDTGSGHMDVDTSSFIYPYRRGKTDGHVHAYDKHFNTTGADFFNLQGNKLHDITENVSPGMKFKIIVANANLSPGARIVINNAYNPSSPATYTVATDYDNTSISSLPVYSLNGLPGTTTLSSFGVYIDPATSGSGGLIQGNTGHVKNNTPGIFGEWRNGALTIQVVKVNSDGSDGFTVNTAFSNGGVQGVATTGLYWEATLFHHGSGGPYSPN